MRSQPAFSFSASLRRIPFVSPAGAAVLGLALSPVGGDAQWTNRYPKVAGYGHHVYLEGYELPVLTAGPIDPAPSPDGERVAFASHGWIWVMDLASGVARRLTRGGGIDARPAWSPDGELVAFVRDDTEDTEIVWVAANGGAEPRTLIEGSIASMARPALSPDGSTVAVNWPTQEGWDLRLLNVADPGPSILLASGGLPLTPAWGPSGDWVYFAEADDRERMHLKRVRAAGGPVEAVEVTARDWGTATASLRIRTVAEEGGAPVAARLAVVDGAGHPLVPARSGSRPFRDLRRPSRRRRYRWPPRPASRRSKSCCLPFGTLARVGGAPANIIFTSTTAARTTSRPTT